MKNSNTQPAMNIDNNHIIRKIKDVPNQVDSPELAKKLYIENKNKIADSILYELDEAVEQGKRIVLVYQMGKVASSSYASLLDEFDDLKVFHVHRLNKIQNDKNIESYLSKGIMTLAFRELRWKMIRTYILTKKVDVFLLTAIRDPIARNLSAYFQNIDKNKTHFVDSLIEKFFSEYQHSIPLRWFDEQFRDALNVDIFKYPFDKERGWDLFTELNYQCLLLTAEISDEKKIYAINSILNKNIQKLDRKNVGSTKYYSSIYKEFKENIIISPEYAFNLLDSKVATHFYTDEQLDKFRRKWLRA